jgi:hypothetical protein
MPPLVQPIPEDLETLEALLKERMPERHLLDILKKSHICGPFSLNHLMSTDESIIESLVYALG